MTARVQVVRRTTCQHCGGPLVQPKAQGRPRKFCSNPCRVQAHRLALRGHAPRF